MTLADFFAYFNQNYLLPLIYFLVWPVAAFVTGLVANDRAAYSPYAYVFMFIIYLVSVPGILAISLSIFQIFVRKADIMQTSLVLQILPVVSMFLTIQIIKKFVDLKWIPGFDKITSLWVLIFVAFAFMWLLDRIHIVVFSAMPFSYLLGIFAVLFGILYYFWKKLT